MDSLDRYRDIIEKTLSDIAAIPQRYADIGDRTVFDRRSDNYLIIREGWQNGNHTHACVVHLELRDAKVWIQKDGIEEGIAHDLERAGIPKHDIVLGFYPPDVRLHTEYAAA